MGSTPSTPVHEGSDDPWWPIENQNLELNPNGMNPTVNQNVDSVEQQRGDIENSAPPIDSIESQNVTETEPSSAEPHINPTSDCNQSEIEIVVESSANSEMCDERPSRQQSLEEFKEELRIKREQRSSAISELRNEITSLRSQLAAEKEITKQLRDDRNKENLCQICGSIYNSLDSLEKIETKCETNGETRESTVSLRSQLAELQVSLQTANAEILTLTNELTATKKQVKSLKEVIAASKEIITIRETELIQLKAKFKDIETSLAEREMHLMSENLRHEYDRQLANIRNLRALYEERARVSAAEKENLNRQLETGRAELGAEIDKNKNLEDHIASLDTDLKSTTTDLFAAKEQLTYYKAENKTLRDEMTVINKLFGQLLAGFNGNNNIDIDKLTLMLEENRDLLNDITNKEYCKDGAAQFPRMIFDLVSQDETSAGVSEENKECLDEAAANDVQPSTSTAEPTPSKMSSAQEIIHNLPKVWRVLIELLNHQQLKPVQLLEENKGEHCYKSVQTPTGPQMVLSVSKTYIRLKDLIMEKKFLQKETKKLKNLNAHLGSRLDEKEQRLGAVTIELNKTWNLVGRMQRQHRQLHTHEQVLRYQLQQKRRMLTEIKEELEYCRRKWTLAKEKNNESQSQWETLRQEFSKRKESDLNASGESGYSDSPASEEDEDTSISNEKPRVCRLKKKLNMENFLLASESNDRKSVRVQSESPERNARESVARRNSDSHITQFATEVFQATADVVEPMVTICAECGENCVKHSVHFETDPAEKQSTEQVKVSEPVVHSAKQKQTNAQKLVESKASTSKTKMSCEVRKAAAKPSTSKTEESLEEMFLRLSGAGEDQTDAGTSGNEEIQEEQTTEIVDTPTSTATEPELSYEEREALRLARIERLEGQCKQLLKQVTRASDRGDELKQRVHDIHSRYSTDRETPSTSTADEPAPAIAPTPEPEPEPSTSGTEKPAPKTDEECLSATEQEYLTRRDERLKRLEAETQAYMDRVKSNNRRATDVDNKLEFLHGRYGSETDNGASSELNEDASGTEEEQIKRREERLNQLVAESQANTSRVLSDLTQQDTDIDGKLDELHERCANDGSTTNVASETSTQTALSENNVTSPLAECVTEESPPNQNQSEDNQSSPSDNDANHDESSI